MRKRFFFNKVLLVTSLACYLCVFISPGAVWPAGFLAISIPVWMICNLAYLIYWLLLRQYRYALLTALVIVLGYKFIDISVTFSLPSDKTPDFHVLDYNVRVFNAYDHLNKNLENSRGIVRWVKEDSSEIKCFQEFYNLDSEEPFNTVAQLKRQGYNSFFKKSFVNPIGGQFGIAIFSRYPIINSGEINLQDKSYNDAIFADVLIGHDTVRIYNVHLQSMHINEQRLMQGEKIRENLFYLVRRLRKGFIARSRQVELIAQHVAACPFRVILCGDLNDLPYSYTYFKLRQCLYNSFEEGGNGLGFSYNGRLFFLRIDNQFYSKGLEVLRYEVDRQVKYSDHFPIKASYAIGPKE